MQLKIALLLLWMFVVSSTLHPFSVEEVNVLQPLFRELMEDAELGYLLYEKKPVCIVPYMEAPQFFEEVNFLDRLSTAIFCSKETLQKNTFNNILFHYDEKGGLLVIINKNLFLNTVKEHLSLFQFVLGPYTTAQTLLFALTSSEKSFFETLCYDKTLTGILLGFGVQNALFHARNEKMQSGSFFIQDLPPFLPDQLSKDPQVKRLLLFGEKNREFTPTFDRRPSFGFSYLEEERRALEAKEVLSSKQLLEQLPLYVVADYGFDPLFIKELEATQLKIQQLLKEPDWFERTLFLIFNEKIDVSISHPAVLPLPFFNHNFVFAKLLKTELLNRGQQTTFFSSFADGLLHSHDRHMPQFHISISPTYARQLKLAQKNLKQANDFFIELDQNKEYEPLMKHFLYYTTLEKGNGAEMDSEDQVCIHFEIFDSLGRCLNESSNCTLNLKELLPAFGHGLKKMRKGEKRLIYIHPALAYGIHTHLDKGVFLKVIVELSDFSQKESHFSLTPLEPMDLSFINSASFLKECEAEYKKLLQFQGRMKGAFLSQLPGINTEEVSRDFLQLEDDLELSPEERAYLHAYLWNFFFVS